MLVALNFISGHLMEVLPTDEICKSSEVGEKGPSRNSELS